MESDQGRLGVLVVRGLHGKGHEGIFWNEGSKCCVYICQNAVTRECVFLFISYTSIKLIGDSVNIF